MLLLYNLDKKIFVIRETTLSRVSVIYDLRIMIYEFELILNRKSLFLNLSNLFPEAN